MSVDEIFQTMRDLVSEQFAMEPAEVTMDTSFEEDLGADSVDLVELVMAMDEEFDMGEANEDELAGLKTVCLKALRVRSGVAHENLEP